MVQAQVLEDTVHLVKINAAAVELTPDLTFSKTGGKLAGPVVLRNASANGTGGYDYEIKILGDTGLGFNCAEETIGTLSTYTAAEDVAFGELDTPVAVEIPEPGLTLFAHFFAQVKTKTGKSGFKSVAGWAEVQVVAEGTPTPEGVTKNLKVQAKERTPEKLGLQCTVGVP
jgi:hypothetical protein